MCLARQPHSPQLMKPMLCGGQPCLTLYCTVSGAVLAVRQVVDWAVASYEALQGRPGCTQCNDGKDCTTPHGSKLQRSVRRSEQIHARQTACCPSVCGAHCAVTGFDCDFGGTSPTIRDMCCSLCGDKPIPDVPTPTPPAPPPIGCSVCNHFYDAARDGNGTAFEDLPDSWVCPVCGAPKAAYYPVPSGGWAHAH